MSEYIRAQKLSIFQIPTERVRLTAWRLCLVLEHRREQFPTLTYQVDADPYGHSRFPAVIRTNCYVLGSDQKGSVTFEIMQSGWFRVKFAQNNMYIGDGGHKPHLADFMSRFYSLKKCYGLLPE